MMKLLLAAAIASYLLLFGCGQQYSKTLGSNPISSDVPANLTSANNKTINNEPADLTPANPATNNSLPTSYVACGCGCCGPEPGIVQCIYHSKGDNLAKIIQEDRRWYDNPDCASMGCFLGTNYTYCD